MSENVKIGIGADSSKAEKELKKTRRQVERLKDKLAETGKQSKKTGKDGSNMAKSFQKVKVPLMGIASALGIGGGIAAGVTFIVGQVEKWKTHMREIAKSSRIAGQEMVAFALMQQDGTKRERVLETAREGAKYGIKMGPAWSTVQAMESQTGSYKKGLVAAKRSWQLAQMGVPQGEAAKAVSIGMGMGLTPGSAARLPYAGGEKSSLSPAEIAAGYSQALPFYKGMKGGAVMGVSVMAQLSTIYKDPSKLGTYTGKFAQALKREKTWRDLGYTGEIGNTFAQLEFLKSKGISTDLELQRAGFGEIRERAALSGMLGDVGKFKEIYTDVERMTGQEGLLKRKRGATEAELPEMHFERLLSGLEAQGEITKVFGSGAERARIRDIAQRVRARMMELKGYKGPQYVDPSTKHLTSTGAFYEAYTQDIVGQEAYEERLKEHGLPTEWEKPYMSGGTAGQAIPHGYVGESTQLKRIAVLIELLNEYEAKKAKKVEDVDEKNKAPMNYPLNAQHPGNME